KGKIVVLSMVESLGSALPPVCFANEVGWISFLASGSRIRPTCRVPRTADQRSRLGPHPQSARNPSCEGRNSPSAVTLTAKATVHMRCVMAQPGPSDYRRQTGNGPQGQAGGIKDQVSEVGKRAGTMAEELTTAIRERPYTTLAIAAGLAFAVG